MADCLFELFPFRTAKSDIGRECVFGRHLGHVDLIKQDEARARGWPPVQPGALEN
jgi:hypothetical protein